MVSLVCVFVHVLYLTACHLLVHMTMTYFGALHLHTSHIKVEEIYELIIAEQDVYKCNTPRSHGLYITYITYHTVWGAIPVRPYCLSRDCRAS